jgi:hypothetical protein
VADVWFVEHDETVLRLDRIEADCWRALHRRIREIAGGGRFHPAGRSRHVGLVVPT